MITAAYVPLANYHAIFPDAMNANTLLQSATGRWNRAYDVGALDWNTPSQAAKVQRNVRKKQTIVLDDMGVVKPKQTTSLCVKFVICKKKVQPGTLFKPCLIFNKCCFFTSKAK